MSAKTGDIHLLFEENPSCRVGNRQYLSLLPEGTGNRGVPVAKKTDNG